MISKRSGCDVMHAAAQGDSPNAMYFLYKKLDMDPDSKDANQSTPLHWAVFTG